MSDDSCLRPGLRVQTYNRRPVGVIQRVDNGRLLLRDTWRRPFWISTGLVRSVDEERATLHIDSRVVSRYRYPAKSSIPGYQRQLRALRLPLMGGGLAGVIVALMAIL